MGARASAPGKPGKPARRTRAGWLGESVALGTGIWAMHFVGMLAALLIAAFATIVLMLVASGWMPRAFLGPLPAAASITDGDPVPASAGDGVASLDQSDELVISLGEAPALVSEDMKCCHPFILAIE